MLLRVQLASLVAVVLRVEVVGVGDVGMMGGLFVETGPVRVRRSVVMTGGVLMVGGGVLVMLDLLLVGHVFSG